jgi:hypothetical protein
MIISPNGVVHHVREIKQSMSNPIDGPAILQDPLPDPRDHSFEAIFCAKLAFVANSGPEAESPSVLDRLRRERVFSEIVALGKHGSLGDLNAACQTRLASVLLTLIHSRRVPSSDEVRSDGWTIPFQDASWGHCAPEYELLTTVLRACPAFHGFDVGGLRKLFSRTESSDARERAAASTVLNAYYDTRTASRPEFLSALSLSLVDLKDGELVPFAGPTLLAILSQAMDHGMDVHHEEFRQIFLHGLLPLAAYRWLPGILSPLVQVFRKYLVKDPLLGPQILSAIQKYWPCSTRASASARLAMAVFCAWDGETSAQYIPRFFSFMADGLWSPDSGVVTATLGILEHQDGQKIMQSHAPEAIQKLVPPIVNLQKRHWHAQLSEKAAALLQTIEMMNRPLFERITAHEKDTPAPDERSFLDNWKAVIRLAKERDGRIPEKGLIDLAEKWALHCKTGMRIHRIVEPETAQQVDVFSLPPVVPPVRKPEKQIGLLGYRSLSAIGWHARVVRPVAVAGGARLSAEPVE